MIDGLIRGLIDVVIETVLTKTGRGLWGLVGVKPHDLVAMFSGMLFWIVVGVFVYGMIIR